MGKKKAIKLATATAIAASAFVAVAPTQSEAATSSVDKAITKATNQMAKAYDTYHKAAKNEKTLPKTATIRNEVKLANDYYTAATKEIAKNGGSKTKKADYTKKLEAKKYFLDRAEAYLAAVNTNLNPAKSAFNEAVEGGKQKTVLAAQKAYNEAIKGFEAKVDKIYGPDARDLLKEKYAAPAQKLADSVNDEMKVYNAYKQIEGEDLIAKDLKKAGEVIESVKAEVAKLKEKDTKLAKNIIVAVEKNNKAYEDALVPTVKEVSAINGTQVVIEFTKEVTEINPANIEVTRKDDSSRAYVSQVTVDANDKKKATVTFTSKLADDKTYTVVANGVKTSAGEVKESSSEFTYVKSVVTKVELSSKEIALTGNLKDAVKVTDQLGRDITKEVTLEVQSSNAAIIDATGAAKGEGNAIVNVKVAGTTVQTGNTVITVSGAKQTALVGFHLADIKDAPATTELFKKVKAEDVVTTLEKGTSTDLNLYYNDQFGKSLGVINGTKATYTSLNPSVVAVDASGKVTAISTGVGAVKVKVGEFETTINITVKAASAINELKVNKDVVSAAIGAVSPTFEVSFLDQYNKVKNFDVKYLTVVPADKTVAEAEVSATASKATVTVKAVKEGSTNFVVKYDDGTTKLEKTVAVTVAKAGTINSYSVSSDFSKLDVAAAITKPEDDATEAKLTVVEKDASGNVLKALDKKDTTIKFSSSTPVAVQSLLTIDDENDKVELKKDANIQGTYTATVDVSVGSLTVGTVTYTVSDSSLKATKASFTKTAFDGLKSGEDLLTLIKQNIKFVDQNNTDFVVAAKDVTVDYVLSNQTNGFTISKADGTVGALTDVTKIGSADIVVTGVKVNGSNLITSPVVIKAETSKEVAALETAKVAAKTKIDAADVSAKASQKTADEAVQAAKDAETALDPAASAEDKAAAKKAIEDAIAIQTAVTAEVKKVTDAKAAYASKTSVTDVEEQVKIAEVAAKAAAELVK